MAIGTFSDKRLQRLYEDDDRRRLPANMADRLSLILAALDAAEQIDDMNQPAFKLHPLRGDYAGYWAVTVRSNWRVVFRFEEGAALDIDFVDYH